MDSEKEKRHSEQTTETKKLEAVMFQSSRNPELSKEKLKLVVDFGKVANCTSQVKGVNLPLGRLDHEITYSIKPHPEVKRLKGMFRIDHNEGVLKARKDLKLLIKYSPTIAFQMDVGIFEYVDSDSRVCEITVTGEALGAICQISCKQLLLYKTKDQEHLHSTLEIKNNSKISAEIKLDMVQDQYFQISPTEAIIPSKRYQYFNVRYRPQKYGVFGRKVHGLVWNGVPVVLDLVGVFSKSSLNVTLITFKKYIFTNEESVGFDSFLNDRLTRRIDIPPFSLDKMDLDFGRVSLDKEGGKIIVFSMTNHLKHPLEVEWPNGNENFEIIPQKSFILSNNAIQFEGRFKPTQERKLYFRSFIAQVFWIYEKSICNDGYFQVVPLNCEVKMQGHSFPETEAWPALIEVVPEVITLPPCLSGQKANGTFKLQNKGHLPVAYRLVGPEKSFVTVKPVMGKMKTFEVVAVQHFAEPNQIRNYVEEWKLVINGKESRAMSLYIQGEVTTPVIEVGKENKITVGTIQEGTLRDIFVPLKNKCSLNLRYTIQLAENLTKFMHISPLVGEIPPFQETELLVTCLGSDCSPNIQNFVCSVQIIESQGALVGEPFDTQVEVQVESSYSELCTTPNYQEFGLQPYKGTLTAEFEAHNFGSTNVFFVIEGEDTEKEDDPKHFRITPMEGSVSPGGSIHFRIEGMVLETGIQKISFSYKNRIDRKSGISKGKSVKIFEIIYDCEIPKLQIEEITSHTFGPLFGKSHFWDFLHIDSLNNILKNLQIGEIQRLDLRLPEFQENSKIHTVTLAVKNVSRVEQNVKIKRKKLCGCELKETSDSGFYHRKKKFDCPHREMIKIELTEAKFYESQTQFLTISVKYTVPYETQMCFILVLDHERTLELYFNIFVTPENTWKISCYTPGFLMAMEDVYMGTRVAPVQIFWVYNNTKHLVNYTIQTEELKRICRLDGFKIIECIKPEGQLFPYRSEPLLFKFHPIEEKKYEFQTQIAFQMTKDNQYLQDFQITGNGVMTTSQQNFIKKATFPRVPTYGNQLPVTFSQDYIEVDNLPIWSIQKKLVFIKNNSKNVILEYVFGRVFIENVLEVTVEKSYAMIKPKEVHPILIKVMTLAEPCMTEVLLSCEIMNYTDLILHQKTSQKFEEFEKKLQDEFEFGEKEESSTKKNPVKIHPKPESQIITLTIGIISLHTKDLDTFVPPDEQLRKSPQSILVQATEGILNKYTHRKIGRTSYPNWEIEINLSHDTCLLFSRILEDIISDFVFSKSFKKFLEICHQSPNAYYSEFVMDHRKILSEKIVEAPLDKGDITEFRRKEILKFFNQPNSNEISKFLEKLIYESVLSHFECVSPGKVDISEIISEIEKKKLYKCSGHVCECANESEE